MKNAFYFTLKALLVLEIFKFLSWIFCQVVKHLDQKDTNSKFMMSPPGKQAIGTLILPSISRSKGNQTLKFGQSTEDNMRNIFLEKSNTKCGGEFIPRPFSKKSKLSISLDQ